MSDDRDLDRLLGDHLKQTAQKVPEHVVVSVLDRIPGQPQDSAISIWVGRLGRTLLAVGTATAVVVAAVFGPTVVRNAIGPAGVPSPTAPHEWHRDNYGAGHELLTCVEGVQVWSCAYGDAASNVKTGSFSGRNVTDSWTCPDWFAAEICDPDNIVAVYGGETLYVSPDGTDRADPVAQDYVVTRIDGQDILYLYWHQPTVGTFYCPWFRTFQEALDAPSVCIWRDPR